MTTQPNFRDSREREWNLAISIGVARRIRADVGVDFGKVADGKLFIELSSNPEKLAGALWLMVERQAEQKGVTPEDFAEALDGNAIDGAMEALQEAIVNFTPSHLRTPVKTMLAKTMVAQTKTANAAVTWIEANADQLMNEEIAKAVTKLPTFGKPSPSSPVA